MAGIDDKIRRALVDRYEILHEIGSGGAATVYLANDVRHDRQVAVKVLRPDLSEVLGSERFLREIQIAAQLHHPHILPLYDSGEANGLLYYVMPFQEGRSLRERLREDGAIPISEAVRFVRDVVDALTYAHNKGVVHRDIKPDNVLLSGRHAMVTDFGVAKAISEATGRFEITTAGIAIGTPTYMAPEQAVADPNVDHRADIYAVGALGYELITGQPPFQGAPQAILAAHVTEAPVPVSEQRDGVPDSINDVIMKCLEKTPANRWQTAEELLSRLEPLATPTSGMTPARALTPVARMSWGVRLALVVIPLFVIGLLVTLLARPGQGLSLEIGRTTQLTRAPGLEIDPAISPDVRMVAYVSGPVGRTRTFVRQISGGRVVPLGEELDGPHRRPVWSPDGNEIAFQSGNSIYVVPALGGVARTLVEPTGPLPVHSHVWSPDGSSIAFAEDSSMYVQPVSGGTRRVLAHAFEPHSLAWSPDGASIAYAAGNRNFIYSTVNFANIAPSALWVVGVNGSEPIQVTDNASLNVSPVWGPTGRSLFFVSNRDGSRDVYQVRIGRGGSEGTVARHTTGLNAHTISVNTGATRLTYSVFTHYANIWTLPIPDDGAAAARDAVAVTVGNQAIEAMSVSPDGQWLAFDSDLNGNQDIYKRRLEGGELQQLTSDLSDDFLPEWSPDGTRIAFYSFRHGSRDIFIMSDEGTDVRRITDHPSQERSPNWSPDGERLTFYSNRTGQYEVWTVTTDDEAALQQLTFDGGVSPRWSPDGGSIVYLQPGTPARLKTVSPDGGEPTTLATIGDDVGPRPEELRWSLDGQTVFYKAYDTDGVSSLWAVPGTGGAPRLLVEFDDPQMASNRDDFATDGENLYFTIGALESDIWLMELIYD